MATYRSTVTAKMLDMDAIATIMVTHAAYMHVVYPWNKAVGMAKLTGMTTSPTNRSLIASEIMNILVMVWSDCVVAMTPMRLALPMMISSISTTSGKM